MKDKDRNLLERAAVIGLTVPAGLMGGEMISDAMEGQVSKVERKSKRDEDKERLKQKYKNDEEESSGSSGGSKAIPLNYKKGGTVRSASQRADGCAIRGKTRA